MATLTINFPSGVTTYVVEAEHYDGQTISLSGKTLYSVTACGDVALYYLNEAGGWDAFLIQGKVLRKDKYTQSDYYKSFDNNTIEFGRNRFLTDIVPTWELHTSYLTENQAERLVRNLLPSTKVYLHDLVDNEVYPVVITDTQAEYKTNANQNGKLISYTINVEGSQGDSRR